MGCTSNPDGLPAAVEDATRGPLGITVYNHFRQPQETEITRNYDINTTRQRPLSDSNLIGSVRPHSGTQMQPIGQLAGKRHRNDVTWPPFIGHRNCHECPILTGLSQTPYTLQRFLATAANSSYGVKYTCPAAWRY